MVSRENKYMFNGLLDGFSKFMFTVTPIILAFKDFLLPNSASESSHYFDVPTRVSFLLSVLSLMFFFVLGYNKDKSLRLKIETSIALMFLAISFVLTLVPLHSQMNGLGSIDCVSLAAFLLAVLIIVFETIITFICLDCGLDEHYDKKYFKVSSLPSGVGNFVSARIY